MKKLSDDFVGKKDILKIINYYNISDPENHIGVNIALQVISECSTKDHTDKNNYLSKYIFNCYDNIIEDALQNNKITKNETIIALSIILAYSTTAVNLITDLVKAKFNNKYDTYYIEELSKRAQLIYIENYEYIKQNSCLLNSDADFEYSDYSITPINIKQAGGFANDLEGDDFINHISEQYKDGENYNNTIYSLTDFNPLSIKLLPEHSFNIVDALKHINSSIIAINDFKKEYALMDTKKTFYIKNQFWFDKSNLVYGQGLVSLLIYNKIYETNLNPQEKNDVLITKEKIDIKIEDIKDNNTNSFDYYNNLPF